MNGEVDLSNLLANLCPSTDDRDWVFAAVDDDDLPNLRHHALASFREAEGLTLVLPQSAADGLENVSSPMSRITLEVHSSLEAVGLTAAVAGVLAEEGISANVIAAYYHDHIFVPKASADRALVVLRGLSTSTN